MRLTDTFKCLSRGVVFSAKQRCEITKCVSNATCAAFGLIILWTTIDLTREVRV